MRPGIKYLAVVSCFAISSASAPALADIPELRHRALIEACLEAVERGFDATPYADELLSRSQFHLGEESQAMGLRCLEHVYDASFEFSSGRFASPELDAMRQRRLETEAAEQEDRERQYQAAVIAACRDEYAQDRFRALTTPICADVFRELGLPE